MHASFAHADLLARTQPLYERVKGVIPPIEWPVFAEDIDAYHAQLTAAGVDVDREVSRMGGPVPPLFWLRDPEGNVVMVVG